MERFDILIVGAGAAGIAAAAAAAQAGCGRILLADRGEQPGGILLQCAHRGFGAEQTGPAFTRQLLQDFPQSVCLAMETTVLEITKEKTALLSGSAQGVHRVAFEQLIWAVGCREVPIGALPIAGTRPTGVYTAGQMQAMMNLHGVCPYGPAVILGSGDLGLIMAMQLAEAGLDVTVVEKKPACGGLLRNREAARKLGIPVFCGRTVVEVCGYPELEAVVLDDGSILPCRTFLTAVGLVPEQTLIEPYLEADWLHLCGNCRTVHAMVETVVYEGTQAGLKACQNIRGAI